MPAVKFSAGPGHVSVFGWPVVFYLQIYFLFLCLYKNEINITNKKKENTLKCFEAE